MSQPPTRRDIVAGGTAAVLLATNAAAAAAPPAADHPDTHPSADAPSVTVSHTVNGTVTEVVLDGGRVLDRGPGVAGVLVSNGRDITRTDAAGHYSLSIQPGQTVFVIKPSGYRLPVATATKIPQFSYVHDPQGTPADLNFRYQGMLPTGPLPASVDFQLTRVPEPQSFDVILLTDPQPESTAEIEYVRDDVVAGLIGSDAAFGITCGDIAFDDLSMYGRINRIIGRIGVPWWSVGGNHDLDYEALDAVRSRDTFKRVFGAPYYAHEHGDALFIMLDNVEYLGAAAAKAGHDRAYRGFISADQLSFVKNLLAVTPPERLLVFVMHIPLSTYLDPNAPGENTANAAELLKLIGDRPSVSFSGHTHSTEHHYLGAAFGGSDARPHHHHVLTAVSGSWWSGPLDHRGIASADSYDGTPNGYHMLSIDKTAYTTRYIPAAEPANKQMRISLDTQFHGGDVEVEQRVSESLLLRSPITSDQAAGALVVVNLFDGGPRSSVSMALDDGAPVMMTRVARPDPFVVQLYGRYPLTIKRWVKPMPSSHIWQAHLPPDLRPGAYALKVTATDEYGRTHKDAAVLEIV